MRRSRLLHLVRVLRVLMVALALSAAGRVNAADEPQTTTDQTVTPAQEERAIEHLNKWINAPSPDDPTAEDTRERALDLPGDEEGASDLDRLDENE